MSVSATQLSASTSFSIDAPLFQRLIYFGAMAPSPDNNQPWVFSYKDAGMSVRYEPTRALPSDRHHMFNFASMGMVVENMINVAHHEGFQTQVAYMPDPRDPQLAATIELSPGEQVPSFFHEVPRRHTDRSFFDTRAGAPSDLGALQAAFADEHAECILIQERERIGMLARHLATLDGLRLKIRSFHEELGKSLRFSRAELERTGSGIATDDLGLPPGAATLLKVGRPWAVARWQQRLGFGYVARRYSSKQMINSSGLGLVTVASGSPEAYLRAGQSIQRLWLQATRLGMVLHPLGSYPIFAQMLQDHDEILRGTMGVKAQDAVDAIKKGVPEIGSKKVVLLFRFGYAKQALAPKVKARLPFAQVVGGSAAGQGAPCRSFGGGTSAATKFTYETAFSRNIGLVTEEEQQALRQKTVAIPGMGGVGGIHLVTLLRMGIGGFHIADADTFSLSNFNRQYGAMMSTIGQSKVKVMEHFAEQINPEARLRVWDRWVDADNVEEFLRGCDLVVDSIDAFALPARRLVFKKALELNIPIISAGPLGFSSSMLVFTPGCMGFDEYFHYRDDADDFDNFVNFIVGTAPRPHFLRYMNPTRVSSTEKHGPSSAAAIDLCAGFAGVEALKILLGRGSVSAVPHYHYFDPYLMKFQVGYIPGGGRNPIQRAIFRLARRRLRSKK